MAPNPLFMSETETVWPREFDEYEKVRSPDYLKDMYLSLLRWPFLMIICDVLLPP